MPRFRLPVSCGTRNPYRWKEFLCSQANRASSVRSVLRRSGSAVSTSISSVQRAGASAGGRHRARFHAARRASDRHPHLCLARFESGGLLPAATCDYGVASTVEFRRGGMVTPSIVAGRLRSRVAAADRQGALLFVRRTIPVCGIPLTAASPPSLRSASTFSAPDTRFSRMGDCLSAAATSATTSASTTRASMILSQTRGRGSPT